MNVKPRHTLDRNTTAELLQRALQRRSGSLIGTPLKEHYDRTYPQPVESTAVTFWGAEMEVILPELVSCELYEHGVIEPTMTGLFVDVVTPGTVVFDVGAHLGYYSLLASSLGARVHAFEPSTTTLALLRRNAKADVTIAPVGLWNIETTLTLDDYGPEHSAVSTFLEPKDETVGQPADSYRTSVTTLDQYVEATGDAPDLIKIDAEGAERHILQGGLETIRSQHPLITIEVGDTPNSRTSRLTLEFARTLDYVLYDLTEDGPRPHELRDYYDYGNVLLVPATSEPPRISPLRGKVTVDQRPPEEEPSRWKV